MARRRAVSDAKVSVWRKARAFLTVLWVCRVSALAALAGLVFYFVPQASDLFLDIGQSASWQHWLLFFCAFVGWILALFVSARLAVISRWWALGPADVEPVSAERYQELRALYVWPTRVMPLFIVALGGALVTLAVLHAENNIPRLGTLDDGAALGDHLTVLSTASAGFTIAFLVYILSRYLLSAVPGKDAGWPAFLPALKVEGVAKGTPARAWPADERWTVSRWFVALAVFVCVALTAMLFVLAWRPEVAFVLNRAVLGFTLLAVWVPALTFLARGSHRWRLPLVAFLALGAGIALQFVGDNHRVRTVTSERLGEADPPSADITEALPQRRRPSPAPNGGPIEDQSLVRQRPDLEAWIAQWKRANCSDGECRNPILIAASGGASRAAFFTASALGHLMDLTCPERSELLCETEIEVDGARKRVAFGARPALARQTFAISAVSGSALGALAWAIALEHRDRLFALEASGLRDTATVLPCVPRYDAPSDWQDAAERLGDRLAAALNEETPPLTALRQVAFENWHGARRSRGRGTVANWQDCMELLVAGDYLSPTIASLFTRDVVPHTSTLDRNRVLENAFDRQARAVLKPAGEGTGKASMIGMQRGFLELWREPVRAAHGLKGPNADDWIPLVVSNGSSVEYGNRIITSPIGETRREDDRASLAARQPFVDITDVYALVNPMDGERELCTEIRDVPIQTAVTNSARFPVVSTEGDFPYGGEPDETRQCPPRDERTFGREYNEDQVVDGGFYESSGVTSLYDLATALIAHDLTPFVIVLTNDPSVDLSRGRDFRPLKEGWLGAAWSPIQAVLSARPARGRMSLDALAQLEFVDARPAERDGREGPVADSRGGPEGRAVIRVEAAPARTIGTPATEAPASVPRAASEVPIVFLDVKPVNNVAGEPMDNLSMNWWLSHPVQRTLRAFVLGRAENREALANVCRAIENADARKACCQRMQATLPMGGASALSCAVADAAMAVSSAN